MTTVTVGMFTNSFKETGDTINSESIQYIVLCNTAHFVMDLIPIKYRANIADINTDTAYIGENSVS